MQKEVFVITFLILLSSTVESHAKKPIKKVLSIIKEIKEQMVTVDDMTEIKNQIVDEVVDAINPTIAASCSCCDKPQHCDAGQGIFLAGGIVEDYRAAFPGFYNPLTNKYCNITTQMNHPRESSTTTGFIACGGSEFIAYYDNYDYTPSPTFTTSPTSPAYNCEMFDPSSGTWSNYATWYPSFPGRVRHVAWMSSIGLFLIGGLDSMDTSMLISNDGSITEGAINSGRYGACAVADPKTDTVIILGGYNSSYFLTDEVVRYDIHGNETPLPNLNNKMVYFGCSGYYNNVGNLVLVVTGGDGTQHLEVGVDSTWASNTYSNPWEISCADANNDVYCLQGYYGYDIQEYDKSTGGFIYKSSTEDERGYWGNFASSVCIDSGVDNWCTYSKSGKKSKPQDHSKPFPERSEDDKDLLSDN